MLSIIIYLNIIDLVRRLPVSHSGNQTKYDLNTY